MKLEGGGEGGTERQKEEGPEVSEEKSAGEATKGKEERQKKKADDLWASFLSDVGPRPKAETPDPRQVGDVMDLRFLGNLFC